MCVWVCVSVCACICARARARGTLTEAVRAPLTFLLCLHSGETCGELYLFGMLLQAVTCSEESTPTVLAGFPKVQAWFNRLHTTHPVSVSCPETSDVCACVRVYVCANARACVCVCPRAHVHRVCKRG